MSNHIYLVGFEHGGRQRIHDLVVERRLEGTGARAAGASSDAAALGGRAPLGQLLLFSAPPRPLSVCLTAARDTPPLRLFPTSFRRIARRSLSALALSSESRSRPLLGAFASEGSLGGQSESCGSDVRDGNRRLLARLFLRMAIRNKLCGCALATAACAPAQPHPPGRAVHQPPPTKTAEPRADPDDEGTRVLTEFLAGTRRLPHGDGPSFLIGKSPGPCIPLPVQRPDGFHINYALDPSGDVIAPDLPPRHAVGERDCEIVWSALHMGTPFLTCSRYAPRVLDELYAQIHALRPGSIRTRRIADEMSTIHRGGFTVFWHWPGHACELSDAGDSEVVPGDIERFDALVDWMKGACTSAGQDDCPGVR